MLSDLTIRVRLIVLVGVIMAIGVFVVASAYIGFSNLQNATKDIAERRIHLIRSVNQVMNHMADNRNQILLAIQHDPAGKQLSQIDLPITKQFEMIATNKARIDEYLSDMERDTHSAEGKRILKEFIEARTLYVKDGLLPGLQALKTGRVRRSRTSAFDQDESAVGRRASERTCCSPARR